MPTVIGKTKAEFDKAEMAKRSGQKDDSFPSYKKGDVIVSHASNAHVKVHTIDEKNKGYLGHYHDIEKNETLKPEVDPYIAVPHGAEHSHLYESTKDKMKRMAQEQYDRVKDHPKYERLKTALGKKGAIDALHHELNEQQ
jgi:hypothetical protein